jgi:exopolysaccharide biosynthesis WecB/TagA/CpsF family protein
MTARSVALDDFQLLCACSQTGYDNLMVRVVQQPMLMTDMLPENVAHDRRSRRRICKVDVSSLTGAEAVAVLCAAIEDHRHVKLAFANAHVINVAANDIGFAAALKQSLVLPDGIGVDIGSLLLYGAPFPANLNGTDFIPHLIASSPRPLKVGLIGARPGVAERALHRLAAMAPQHSFRVFSHGFFTAAQEPALLANLVADRPDVLLVAFGNPRQEQWIAEKLGPEHCTIAAGVGALFDFLAEEVTRAPRWVQRFRMEWLFRLRQEPRRLWRRYVLGNPIFLARMLMQKWRRVP